MGSETLGKADGTWKQQFAAIVMEKIKAKYGAEADLPTFPWFLDHVTDEEAKDVLCRLVFAADHDVGRFGRDVAQYIERQWLLAKEKSKFQVSMETEIRLLNQKIQKLRNSAAADSEITVRVPKGACKTFSIASKSQSELTAPGRSATVALDLQQLSVSVVSKKGVTSQLTIVLRDWLCRFPLCRLTAKPPIVLMQEMRTNDGKVFILELSVTLAQRDTLSVLEARLQHLTATLASSDAELQRLKATLEAMVRALGASEALKLKDDGYRERGCEYCRVL